MNNNFFITGHGRCGTKFLAHALNKSNIWAVMHEPKYKNSPKDSENMYINSNSLDEVQKKFDNTLNYGEVNSTTKNFLSILYTKYILIIHRDIHEVITSFANRRNDINIIPKINTLNKYDKLFFNYLKGKTEIKLIDFKKMTSDKDYILKIANHVGITDLNKNNIIFNKVNENKKVKFKTYADVPAKTKNHVDSLTWNNFNELNNWL